MITGHVDLGPLRSLFSEFGRPDLRPVWKAARKPLRADIKEHRQNRRGERAAWAPRAASTDARLGRRARRRILGKLTTALQTVSDARRVAMRSRVKWSAAHNDPGTRTVGHGSRLVQREFLWTSQAVLDVVGAMVRDHLAELWRARRKGR